VGGGVAKRGKKQRAAYVNLTRREARVKTKRRWEMALGAGSLGAEIRENGAASQNKKREGETKNDNLRGNARDSA